MVLRNSVDRTSNEKEGIVLSSAQLAQGYVQKLIAKESKGWGDTKNAMSRLEQKYGLPFWSLDHIRTGRAKTVDHGLFNRIKFAYISYCEQQVRHLQHELFMEGMVSNDTDLQDLDSQVQALATEIKARKAQQKV